MGSSQYNSLNTLLNMRRKKKQGPFTGQVPHDGRPEWAIILAVGVKKELPPRPEDRIPSSSTDGDKLWLLLTDCWAYEREKRPSVNRVRDIVSILFGVARHSI